MGNQANLGYKSYVANLTQASTAAPVATVLLNEFLPTLTWARTSAGIYTLTAASAVFTASKTQVILSGALSGIATVALTSTTVITLTVKDTGTNSAAAVSDDLLSATGIEIRVFN